MHLKGKNLVDLDKANDLIDLKNQIIQDEYQDDNAINLTINFREINFRLD